MGPHAIKEEHQTDRIRFEQIVSGSINNFGTTLELAVIHQGSEAFVTE